MMNPSAAATPQAFRKPKTVPLSVVRIIWKRKLMVAGVWLPLTLAIGAIVYSLPAIYRSEALILVESQRIPERYVSSTVNAELKDRLATISQQIFSYKRLLEIVEKFDLYRSERKNHVQEEIIEMMRADVGIQVDDTWTTKGRGETRPSAFRISYQGPNAEVVAMVANQLASLFLEENLRSREEQARGTSKFLGSQLVEAKKRLEEQEARMSEFKQKHIGELPEQEASLLATLGQVQAQWQAATDALARAEQNKHILTSAIASSEASEQAIAELAEQLNTPEPAGAISADGTLKGSERLQRQLEQAQLLYTEEHPTIKALRNLIPKIRASEEAETAKQTRKPGVAGKATGAGTEPAAASGRITRGGLALSETLIRERERTRSLKAQEEISETQIKAAAEGQAKLGKELTELRQRIAMIPTREQELAVVRRDYEVSRANYQSLMDKGLSANMAAEMEFLQKAERFTMVDGARVAEKPVKPNRPLFAGLGAFLGLLIGLAVGIVYEMKTNSVLGEWELPKGVIVLARVPRIAPFVPQTQGVVTPRRPRVRRWVWVSLLTLLLAAALAGAVHFDWVSLPGIGAKNV